MRSKFSTTEPPVRALPDHVLVGTILRPHGIRGEVSVALWSDNESRFAAGAVVAAVREENTARPSRQGVPARSLKVGRATPYKGGLRVAFEGVEDRDAAEALRGLELWVPRDSVPVAPAGRYYVFELIGCRCVDARDGEVGTVVDIVEDGGGILLEIEREGSRSAIPFVEDFLVRIDRAARTIEVRLPEGLLETCAFKS